MNPTHGPEMNVAGTALAPIDFELSIGDDLLFEVRQFRILAITNGRVKMSENWLDGDGPLANGFKAYRIIDGEKIVAPTGAKNNKDLFSLAGEEFREIENPKSMMIAKLNFLAGDFVLQKGRIETIGMRVCDDLRGADTLRIGIFGFRTYALS